MTPREKYLPQHHQIEHEDNSENNGGSHLGDQQLDAIVLSDTFHLTSFSFLKLTMATTASTSPSTK